MAITESGGRISIRVTGYDFVVDVSKWCQNMGSHCLHFTGGVPITTSFAETVAYYYDYSSSLK